MDEALLTGRFNVHPDLTRRSLSAKSSRGSSAISPTDTPVKGYRSSSRPSSSRADTVHRRSRSAVDEDLFRRQLRLNKSLSRNRFKQDVLDLANLQQHDPSSPLNAVHARQGSAHAGLERAEPEGSELETIVDTSIRESTASEKDSVSASGADLKERLGGNVGRSSEKSNAATAGGGLRDREESSEKGNDSAGERNLKGRGSSEKDSAVHAGQGVLKDGHVANVHKSSEKNSAVAAGKGDSNPRDGDTSEDLSQTGYHAEDKESQGIDGLKKPHRERDVGGDTDGQNKDPTNADDRDDVEKESRHEPTQPGGDFISAVEAHNAPAATPWKEDEEEVSRADPPAAQAERKRDVPLAELKRRRPRRTEPGQYVLGTHGAGPRKDRSDGAIIINPQRNKTRYDVTYDVLPPRRWSPPPRRLSASSRASSSALCYSPSSLSSSGDEVLTGLIGHTPPAHLGRGRRKRGKSGLGGRSEEEEEDYDEDEDDEGEYSGLGTSGKLRRGERFFRLHESNSDQYDTDFEVEGGSEFKAKERNRSASCMDIDIGHLTYEAACARFKVVPRRRIIHQLTTSRLQVNFCGLSRLESKALSLGLLHNHRLDELDLASNGMSGISIAYIADTFRKNIFITKLNLSGNHVQEEGAISVAEMLTNNTWLTHLNLADCGISGHEMVHLAKGIQENSTVVCLNLSKNKIDIHGGRSLGTAIGHNNSIECLNLSWNQLRGPGSVAVCNSLQKNRTLQEINLAWNGMGFQGSLAISEALKVNPYLTKLDISNNRVDWDCMPFLAKAMTINRTLEVLELGHNPVSMEGCMKLLEAIHRPASRVKFLSLAEIPISNTIAFKATEISKTREFAMEHGGIISTRDIFGIKRIRREDPLTLLIRYLSTMGIRVVDLFRVFDTTSNLYVSQANFIRGLKKVRAPLEEEDMVLVARRMNSNKRGDISYQELAASVRGHIREERKEDQRLQRLEQKMRKQRRRILENDLSAYAPPAFTYLPALYNMYDANVVDRLSGETPPRGDGDELSPLPAGFSRTDSRSNSHSQRGSSVAAPHLLRGKTPSSANYKGQQGQQHHGKSPLSAKPPLVAKTPPGFLPRIETPKGLGALPIQRLVQERGPIDELVRQRGRGPAHHDDPGRRTPMTLVRHGTKGIPGTRRPLYRFGSIDKAVGGDKGGGTRRGTPLEARGRVEVDYGPDIPTERVQGHLPPGLIGSPRQGDGKNAAAPKSQRYADGLGGYPEESSPHAESSDRVNALKSQRYVGRGGYPEESSPHAESSDRVNALKSQRYVGRGGYPEESSPHVESSDRVNALKSQRYVGRGGYPEESSPHVESSDRVNALKSQRYAGRGDYPEESSPHDESSDRVNALKSQRYAGRGDYPEESSPHDESSDRVPKELPDIHATKSLVGGLGAGKGVGKGVAGSKTVHRDSPMVMFQDESKVARARRRGLDYSDNNRNL